MTTSRRKALGIIGGGTVLAAAAGTAFLSTRTPARALEPWSEAGDYREPRRRALSFALLAPNPHNLQPWLVDLSRPDRVRLLRDPSKALPETDPFDRQITIGMGCFLELMAIAASQTGHGVEIEPFPEGEGGPIADARFVAGGAEPDALFGAVPHRRSCKEPFEERPVEPAARERLAALATIVDEPGRVEALRQLTWASWQTEARTPRTHMESVRVMRIGKKEIEASPDGIDLGGPFLESLATVGLLSREGQADPGSFEYAEGFRIYEEMLLATPAYVAQVTAGNTRLDQIETGRRWLRLNLAATALGCRSTRSARRCRNIPSSASTARGCTPCSRRMVARCKCWGGWAMVRAPRRRRAGR